MSDGLLALLFVVAAAVSLATSWVLVTRLERVGARLGLSEALLGMVAALAADAPEITSAVTALVGHHSRIGAGVVIGSNVFNLAALLGVCGGRGRRIGLHRRVIVFEGSVAIVIAVVCLAVTLGGPGPGVGLLAAAAVWSRTWWSPGSVRVGCIASGCRMGGSRGSLGLSRRRSRSCSPAIHPQRGGRIDAAVAGLAVLVVVGASVAMEQTASTLGARYRVPEIVIGGLILAGVTSLPNAVAALYLAGRGRGSATLSTALNSNALNVTAGLLLPGMLVGLGAPSGQATLVAAWYLGLTMVTLVCAYSAQRLAASARSADHLRIPRVRRRGDRDHLKPTTSMPCGLRVMTRARHPQAGDRCWRGVLI